ncbi:MAG TPA: hypothetical protein VGK73_32495 [Polyangiaceae bacterium]
MTPGFRQPWEPPFYSEASIALLRQDRRINRHPHPGLTGNKYSPSRVGKARAEAALALDAAGSLRRQRFALYDTGTPSGRTRFGDIWYRAWRDAACWRVRAEDSMRRGRAHDVAATSGHRLKTAGDKMRLADVSRLLGSEPWSVWEWDRISLGHGTVGDRLLSRTDL